MFELNSATAFAEGAHAVNFDGAEARWLLLNHLMQNRDMLLCDAMRIVRSQDCAEDVLQDAAVRCLTSRAVKERPDNPCGFLRRMVRNIALDHYRKHIREIPCDAFADELVCPSTPVEQRLVAHEDRTHLARAIGELCPKRRRVFVDVRLKGKPQKETARDMSLSPSRIHALLQSAEAQLTVALTDER